VNLQEQLLTVSAMALCGGAMGILFDCYRVVAGYARMRRWLYPIFDLLYWAAALALVFPALMAVNQGDVRVYVLLSILLGVSAYFGLVSHWMVKGIRLFIRFAEITAGWLARLFDALVVRPLRLLRRLVLWAARMCAALAVFIGKIVLQCIRPFWLLARWITRPLHRYFAFVPRLCRKASDMFGRLRRKR
jgi:spore cortex biosynthesis protein YabQ